MQSPGTGFTGSFNPGLRFAELARSASGTEAPTRNYNGQPKNPQGQRIRGNFSQLKRYPPSTLFPAREGPEGTPPDFNGVPASNLWTTGQNKDLAVSDLRKGLNNPYTGRPSGPIPASPVIPGPSRQNPFSLQREYGPRVGFGPDQAGQFARDHRAAQLAEHGPVFGFGAAAAPPGFGFGAAAAPQGPVFGFGPSFPGSRVGGLRTKRRRGSRRVKKSRKHGKSKTRRR